MPLKFPEAEVEVIKLLLLSDQLSKTQKYSIYPHRQRKFSQLRSCTKAIVGIFVSEMTEAVNPLSK